MQRLEMPCPDRQWSAVGGSEIVHIDVFGLEDCFGDGCRRGVESWTFNYVKQNRPVIASLSRHIRQSNDCI